jgi:2-amino-4-hydroxy-6-hydroxymethyldihydropteridine diphosphokinase
VARALLGFGGNLGDPVAAIEAALTELDRRGAPIVARSGFYRTPPWGPVAQPDFVNLCAQIDTALAPPALLALTQSIETELGRTRDIRWGPRSIDIDVLAYEGIELASPGLAIPHPRLTERAFVLVPLLDIAPDWVVAGRPIRDWAESVDPAGITRIDAAEPVGR